MASAVSPSWHPSGASTSTLGCGQSPSSRRGLWLESLAQGGMNSRQENVYVDNIVVSGISKLYPISKPISKNKSHKPLLHQSFLTASLITNANTKIRVAKITTNIKITIPLPRNLVQLPTTLRLGSLICLKHDRALFLFLGSSETDEDVGDFPSAVLSVACKYSSHRE